MRILARGLALLFIMSALGGCAAQRTGVSGADARAAFEALPGSIELAETPFFPQEALQCGPAALATVLGAAGVVTHPDVLAEEVYTPGLGGSLQLELAAAARSRGLVPYQLAPDPGALLGELEAGRPVLVMQNLRLRTWPAWHYAVVIGAEPERQRFLLRSGADYRLELPARRFLRSWALADYWGLVLLEPGELPAVPDQARYFDAVAGLEETGRHADAARGWRAALEAWPGDPVARFGLATASYLAGDLEIARDEYLVLVQMDPGHAAALNNLALVMADLGCPATARSLAREAAAHAEPGGAVAAAAADTLAKLPTHASDAAHCEPSPVVFPYASQDRGSL